MPIRKTHTRGHGQAAVYITLPDGATLRWENYKDVPLRELATQLRATADSVETCAGDEGRSDLQTPATFICTSCGQTFTGDHNCPGLQHGIPWTDPRTGVTYPPVGITPRKGAE
jgi:hypothetical protein